MVPNHDSCSRVLFDTRHINQEYITQRVIPMINLGNTVHYSTMQHIPGLTIALITELIRTAFNAPRIFLLNSILEHEFRNDLFISMVKWAADCLYVDMNNHRVKEPSYDVIVGIARFTIDYFTVHMLTMHPNAIYVDQAEGNRLSNLSRDFMIVTDQMSRLDAGKSYGGSRPQPQGPYGDYGVPAAPAYDSRSYGQPVSHNTGYIPVAGQHSYNQAPVPNTPVAGNQTWVSSNNVQSLVSPGSGPRPVNEVPITDRYESYNKINQAAKLQQSNINVNQLIPTAPVAQTPSKTGALPVKIATYKGEQAMNRESHKLELEYYDGAITETSKPTPVIETIDMNTSDVCSTANTLQELVSMFKYATTRDSATFRCMGEVKDTYYSERRVDDYLKGLKACKTFPALIHTLKGIPAAVKSLDNEQLYYDIIGAVGAIDNKLTKYFNEFLHYQLGANLAIDSFIADYSEAVNVEIRGANWLMDKNALDYLANWEKVFLSDYFASSDGDGDSYESSGLRFRKKYVGIVVSDMDEKFLLLVEDSKMVVDRVAAPGLFNLLNESFREVRIGSTDLIQHVIITRDDVPYVIYRDIDHNFTIRQLTDVYK